MQSLQIHNSFIIHSKYFMFLTTLFLQNICQFLGIVLGLETFSFHADTPQKVDGIHLSRFLNIPAFHQFSFND